jgi:hypothetical protein
MAWKVKVLHCRLFVMLILILPPHLRFGPPGDLCRSCVPAAVTSMYLDGPGPLDHPSTSLWHLSVACRCSPPIAVTCSLHSLLDRISKWRCWKVSTSLQRTAYCSSAVLQTFTLRALSMALSTRQRCILYKLTLVQLVNKFPAFYAIRGFMIVSRGSCHWSVSSARRIVTYSSS